MKTARHDPAGLFSCWPPPYARPATRCALLCLALLAAGPAALHAQLQPSASDSLQIDAISIHGNDAFSEGDLRFRMTMEETPSGFSRWLHGAFGAGFPFAAEARWFDPDAFQADLNSLRQFYKNNGFFHAVVQGEVTRAADSGRVVITFHIVEGSASHIDSVIYRDVDDLPADLRSAIAGDPLLRQGRRYNADDVQAEAARVRGLLADNGFPRVSTDSVLVQRRLSTNNVTVTLPFRHGRRLYFGAIREDIRGVDELNLSRQIIRERLDFGEGDVYSKKKQDEAEVSINRLNVFSSVQMYPSFPPMDAAADSLVPLRMELTPQKKYELTYGVLLSDQLKGLSAGLEAGYVMRNVFGGAQSVTFGVEVLGRIPEVRQTYKTSAQLRFDQPYFFGRDNRFWTAASYSLVGEADLATGDIAQFAVGALRMFSPRLTGSAEWAYEISTFDGDPKTLLGSGLIYIDTTETINYRNSIVTLSMERDQTNDLFNPSKGWSLKGILESAGWLEKLGVSILPLANYEKGIATTEYFKAEVYGKVFTDLSRNRTTIFGAKLRLGNIDRFGDSRKYDLPVPPNRRYYAGGPTSVRGWLTRELAVDSNAVNVGSNTLLETSAEVRWHLFPANTSWPGALWTVFFVDAGNLWNALDLIRLQQAAVAFGPGLRYNLPFFGPLRLDFGMKAFDPSLPRDRWFWQRRFWEDIVRGGVFQISIGQAF